MSKRVLVVAAHADDEVLGCGGTIAKHVYEGDTVDVIFMADGVASRNTETPTDLQLRNVAAENVRNLLKINAMHFLGLRDNRMDGYDLLDIVKVLDALMEKIKPDIIYTHHYGDLNVDHRITHQAVMTICRPQPGSGVKKIYTFEVMSSTEWQAPHVLPFIPNVYVDISSHWESKRKALELYDEEMRKAPHSRSFENLEYLARHRGHSVGLQYAEAFMLIREIN